MLLNVHLTQFNKGFVRKQIETSIFIVINKSAY